MHVSRWLTACAISAIVCGALTHAQRPASATFTIDDLVRIKHPSGHQWTPDGSHVWWTYDDGGVNNVWTAAADGSGQPVQLTKYPDGQTGAGGFWSPDGRTFFFQRGGGLQAVSSQRRRPARRVAIGRARQWFRAVAGRIDGRCSSSDRVEGRGGGGRWARRRRGECESAGGRASVRVRRRSHRARARHGQRSAHRARRSAASAARRWSPDSTRIAYTTTTGGADRAVRRQPGERERRSQSSSPAEADRRAVVDA